MVGRERGRTSRNERPQGEPGDGHRPDGLSDRALLRAAQRGDRDAFAALYERHHPALLRRCRRVLGDAALAEDAVQDAFERAMGALERIEPPDNVSAWLATIALNRAIDLARRRGFEIPTEHPGEESGPDAADPTFERVWSAGAATRLAAALAALPPHERRALLRQGTAGWRYAAIAAAEGLSLSAVKSIIHRARARLRALSQHNEILGALTAPAQAVARGSEQLRAIWEGTRSSEKSLGLAVSGLAMAATVASLIMPPDARGPRPAHTPSVPKAAAGAGQAVGAEMLRLPETIQAVAGALPITIGPLDDAAPDLRVTVAVDRTEVEPGGLIRYSHTITNVGSATARDVWLFMPFPEHTTFVGDPFCDGQIVQPNASSPTDSCLDPGLVFYRALTMGLRIVDPTTGTAYGLNAQPHTLKPGISRTYAVFVQVDEVAQPGTVLRVQNRAEASNHPRIHSNTVVTVVR